jgi:hypothetical protein
MDNRHNGYKIAPLRIQISILIGAISAKKEPGIKTKSVAVHS